MGEDDLSKQAYNSISIKTELVDQVKQIINQSGTYHSVAEFASEAIRLRVETCRKNMEKEAEAHEASNGRKNK